MRTITCKISEDKLTLYPIGDLHIGEKGFGKKSLEKIKGYVEHVRKTPNARIFLNGDILNCATIKSPSSPFEQSMDLEEQLKKAIEIFTPVKDKIIGAIDGNHEQRLKKFCGYSPTIPLCRELEVPYLGTSAVVVFRVGLQNKGNKRLSPKQTFTAYFHHTSGGGSTIGGRMNKIDKLRKIIVNCDLYCGSHNHMLGVIPTESNMITSNTQTPTVQPLRQLIISCGGYLEWNDSYAEQQMLEPLKMGSPRITLMATERKKDIHVSV